MSTLERASKVGRVVTFMLLAAVIVGAPAYTGLLGRSDRRWIPRWIMFRGKALDFYEVRFERESDNGRVPIDHYQLLGYPSRYDAPRWIRRVQSEANARRLARLVCRKLRREGPVYMRVRDAKRAGWRTLEDGTANVCDRARR